MAENILQVARETGKKFVVISRSDSTARALSTGTGNLKDVIEAGSDQKIDGEIIYPFFKEGGRFTIDNVHYVQEGDELVPAGETEFAKDKSFGYKASHLASGAKKNPAANTRLRT